MMSETYNGVIERLLQAEREGDNELVAYLSHEIAARLALLDIEILKARAAELEAETGKAHPVFSEGEVIELRGGKWKIQKLLSRGRMMLKAVPY